MNTRSVDVCIVGGGPAGMTLALLLCRRGHKVLVLERHRDFAREYRGEVLMPRFSQLFSQVGLTDLIESTPHLKMDGAKLYGKEKLGATIRFEKICPEKPYAIWMTQPDLLTALHGACEPHPSFEMWFGCSVRSLTQLDGKVEGLEVKRDEETFQVRAKVTIGADGRYSTVRKLGNFELDYSHYGFDVLWFTLPRPKNYGRFVEFHFSPQQMYLIAPKHPDLLQVGLLCHPHALREYRKKGIESLRNELKLCHPLVRSFAETLEDFTPFFLLQAKVELVKEWAQHGCLLIGDAAHTCSPIGAIGVSIAVGTAIVAADVLDGALASNRFDQLTLGEVQRRRNKEVRDVHRRQLRAQRLVTGPSLLRRLAPRVAGLASKIGMLESFLRPHLARQVPLPIAESLPH